MKILRIVLIAAFTLASAGANADFISSASDGCKLTVDNDCTLAGRTDPNNNWVVPSAANGLDGAEWVAPDERWGVVGDFSVWEVDVANEIITSLLVSYDDTLKIKIGSDVVWDSDLYGSPGAWAQVFDVTATTGDLLVGPTQRISFYVSNTGGPTGVIWKGSSYAVPTPPVTAGPPAPVTAVPEPGTLALLGLGLAGMGMTRRKKKV